MLQVTAEKMCRACATTVEENCQEDAYRQFQKFRNLYSVLSEQKVSDDDDLPKRICSTCAGLLETCENFKEVCAQSVDSIRKLIVANLKEEPVQEYVSAEALEPIVKNEDERFQVETKNVSVKRKRKSVRGKKRPSRVRPMCALCDKTFVDMNGIRRHMKLELKRKASVTNVEAKIENNQEENVKSLKNDQRPMCHLCGKTFVDMKGIRDHMKVELKRAGLLHCPQEGCRRLFKTQENFDKHIKRHEDRKISTWCSSCNRTFLGVGHFRRHMEVFHKATGSSTSVCPTCNEDCKTVYRLKAHILKSHCMETKTYVCETCGVRYLSEVELHTHTVSHHQSGKCFNYTCHHCGAICLNKRLLLSHLIGKHTAPVYETCTICGDQVLQAKLPLHHRHKHSGQVHQCKTCNKQFSRAPLLNRHLKIHSDQRPYVCHLCGKSLKRLHSLKQHLYVHSGERPIHCEHCGKGFYKNYALKIHMNIHKREWIAQGQKGIELMVYLTSNKSKNSTEKRYANLKQ